MSTKAKWLGDAKYGVICHYLDTPASAFEGSTISADDWNRRVDSFDVPKFADQIRESGAGYLMFTIGQNGGHYCAPNPVYDELVQVRPSWLSKRDLFQEIAQALSSEIKVCAYLPSHAPALHPEAVRALKCTPPWDASKWSMKKCWPDEENADESLTDFKRKWEAIIRYWSEKWGKLNSGWWIDGVYFADRLYRSEAEPNFTSLARALRAGNPDSILAFGSGTANPFEQLTPEQDYTAGEVSNKLPFYDMWSPLQSETNGMQTHFMSFLGGFWSRDGLRFPDDLLVAYTRFLNELGAAITWDVPIGETGEIPAPFIKQLKLLRSA